MTKVFISYGNKPYRKALNKILREAKSLGVFSKVIGYTPSDLPEYLQFSALRMFKRGDGYWLWKPYIIWKTMSDYPNSIVVYADAGCTLHPNMDEWNMWFNLLEEYDTLVFRYWDCNVIKFDNKVWCKSEIANYFMPLLKDDSWLKTNQLMGGIILCCRQSKVIKMWMELSIFHPELFYDIYGAEIENQCNDFIENRHDQSILSAITAYYSSFDRIVKVLPETGEHNLVSAAISATRCAKIKEEQVSMKTVMINCIKSFFGIYIYIYIREKLSKTRLYDRLRILLENKRVSKK